MGVKKTLQHKTECLPRRNKLDWDDIFFSVVSVKKAIESLLENDLDMSDLYLSEGEADKSICSIT